MTRFSFRWGETPELEEIHEQLANIQWKLNQLLKMEIKQMATMEEAVAATTEQTEVVASAVTLLNGIAGQLEEALAANDPGAVQAVVDGIRANTDTLAQAVEANTPAAPSE